MLPDEPHSPEPPYRLDRTAYSVVPMEQQDDEGAYWQTKTPIERLRALEYLRRMAYGSSATARLQRVLTVAELGED